jgi:hypothetical protein
MPIVTGILYFLLSQVLFEIHTPLAHMKLRTEFRYFAEPGVPDILVAYVVGNWYSQWHQDVSALAIALLSTVFFYCYPYIHFATADNLGEQALPGKASAGQGRWTIHEASTLV